MIDQTGSQSGWPIEKAKETMRHCIQNLHPGDTFQLLGFNTTVYPCFPAPVPATPPNIQRALAYLKPLAGAGGTDILKAADYALKIPLDPARLRIICFMTDGYVGNDRQILDYIGKHRGEARFFPFGIGNAVNRFLIEGMAREGRGAAQIVTLREPGQTAAATFYRRVADPVLLNPEIRFGDLPVAEVYPRHIPDVFSAAPLVLKGRYTRPARGKITVRGLLSGRPWSQTLEVNLPAATSNNSAAIATLWARERIEDLQRQDWPGAPQTNNSPTNAADIKEQIILTPLAHGLMSQFTSFVAVEERVVNVGGKQRTVDVPVEMPEGVSYQGIFGDTREESDLAFSGRSFGGGGFAGRGAAPAPMARKAAPALDSIFSYDADNTPIVAQNNADVRDNTSAGKKRLAALSLAARRALLREAKLAPTLREILARAPKASQQVDVQLWLSALPAGGLADLKAGGFELSATLTPGKLLLGAISTDKLDALVQFGFVRYVEPAKFK